MSETERPKADLIERIRKLLSKTTENGCTIHEAEAAFAMASKLMAEHNLAMDEVTRSSGGSGEAFVEEDIHEIPRLDIEASLAASICKRFFFVETIRHHVTVKGKSMSRIAFFGTKQNVDTARFIYNALLDACDRLWRNFRILQGAGNDQRRAYIAGVMSGYTDKMAEERRVLQMERDLLKGTSGGTAIQLASIVEKTHKGFVEKYPNLRSGPSLSPLKGSQSAIDAGYAAGRNLNLNKALGGSGRPGKGLPGK